MGKIKTVKRNIPKVGMRPMLQIDPDSWRAGKTTAERGYGGKWQRLRRLFLDKYPLCVECAKIGRVETATVVDHITPHRGDESLFWDETNWQSLCEKCHNKKTGNKF